MEINKHEVARRINIIRTQHGMTLEEFGKQFNTSKNSVHNWESARNLPNSTRLIEIADFSNIELEELLYGNPENKFSVDNYLTKNLYSYVDNKREVIKQEVKLLTSASLEGILNLIGFKKELDKKGLEDYERHRKQINELEEYGISYIKSNYDDYGYNQFLKDFPNSDSNDFQKYKENQWSVFKEILDNFWEAFDIVNKNHTWVNNRFTSQISPTLDKISDKAVKENKEEYYINEIVQPFLDQAAKDFKKYIKENTDIE